MKSTFFTTAYHFITYYNFYFVHSQLQLTEEIKQLIGSDIDFNNCIPSTGYEWCNATQSCERSWEITCLDCDMYNCLTFHGYEWCNTTLRCQNRLYSSCPGEWEIGVIGIETDEYGCCESCGERWCSESNSCVGEGIPCPYDCYYG